MKTNLLKVVFFFSLSLFITSCGENVKEEPKVEPEKSQVEEEEESEISKEEMQADYDRLKEYTNKDGFFEMFESKEDKVNGGGWFFYSGCCKKNETHIEVPIASNGYFYLKAHYTGKDWLFFKSITVSIDGEARSSSTLSFGSDMKVEKTGGKGIYETAHFTKPSLDMEIVRLIAENTDKEIIVRFNGDELNYDLTLSKLDKQRIKDCYMLARYTTYQENDTYSYIGDSDEIEHKLLLTKHGVPTGDIKEVNYSK